MYAANGNSGRHLWEFVRDLLLASDNGDRLAGDIIRWENRAEGIFRIVDSKQVAQLWGVRKRNKNMTYEKLSRALRYFTGRRQNAVVFYLCFSFVCLSKPKQNLFNLSVYLSIDSACLLSDFCAEQFSIWFPSLNKIYLKCSCVHGL